MEQEEKINRSEEGGSSTRSEPFYSKDVFMGWIAVAVIAGFTVGYLWGGDSSFVVDTLQEKIKQDSVAFALINHGVDKKALQVVQVLRSQDPLYDEDGKECPSGCLFVVTAKKEVLLISTSGEVLKNTLRQ